MSPSKMGWRDTVHVSVDVDVDDVLDEISDEQLLSKCAERNLLHRQQAEAYENSVLLRFALERSRAATQGTPPTQVERDFWRTIHQLDI